MITVTCVNKGRCWVFRINLNVVGQNQRSFCNRPSGRTSDFGPRNEGARFTNKGSDLIVTKSLTVKGCHYLQCVVLATDKREGSILCFRP